MHKLLLMILLVCFTTEFINSILLYNNLSIRISSSLSMILHHSLWLLLLIQNLDSKKGLIIGRQIFILFAIINFIFIESFKEYNYYTFVLGAILYICFFIYENYIKLKNENLVFFISNNYILLFSPLLFFFGLSLMFGFKEVDVTSAIVFDSVTLYKFIINIVCVFYYALLNIYIFRERKNNKNG